MRTSLLIFLFITIFLSSFSQLRLDSGLVAYYPFSGNANDASGNGNDAIFNNATLAADKTGNPNNAYFFNGIDNYIRIANAPGINPPGKISICALVKPMGFYKGPCHGNSILMKGDADYLPGNYVLRFDDDSYTFQNNCNTSIVDTIHQNFYGASAQTPSPGYAPYINVGQWYCLAYTNDNSVARFYVDGILIYTQSDPARSFTNSYDLFLGRLNDATFPYWFNGVMDEVRIYNRAINDQEVIALCPSGGALPVTITKFATNIVSRQIKLDWNVEDEDGVTNYTIERSMTGHSDFITIGTVSGNRLHSYSFVDNTAEFNQNYYYRLVIHENTNTITYSDIRTARLIAAIESIMVYPNPSKGNIIVKVNDYSGKAGFTLTNSIGQILFQQSALIINNSPLHLNFKEPKGIYWLKIETNNESSVQRIMIY